MSPIIIAATRASGLTAPPRFSTSPGTVGIKVGITTPEAEEKKDITPAVKTKIADAVLGVISLANALDNTSMPPSSAAMLINTQYLQ